MNILTKWRHGYQERDALKGLAIAQQHYSEALGRHEAAKVSHGQRSQRASHTWHDLNKALTAELMAENAVNDLSLKNGRG